MGQGPQPDPGQSQQYAQQQYQQQQYQQQQYQQYYQQQQQYPQQYYQQYGQQSQQPPARKRGRKGGVFIGILSTVLVLGLAFGGYWLWYEMDSDDDAPPLDTSLDLADAPMGCGMFTEDEIRPLFPGRFATEPGSGLHGNSGGSKSAQCFYSNTDTNNDAGEPHVSLSVNTKLLKADHPEAYRAQSGVDRARDALEGKPGQAIGVPNATDDRFREIENTADEAAAGQLSFQYRNVVVSLHYSYDDLGEGNYTQPLMQLAELAIKKIDPQAGQQQAPSAAPSVPGIPGGNG